MTVPPTIPIRSEWPDWVKLLVEQKETFIDQRDSKIDEMAQELEQARQLPQVIDYSEVAAITVAPTMTIDALVEREQFIHRVIHEVFKPGVHYGPPFPSSDKTSLYKTGAEWLLATFELRPDFIEVEKVVERHPDRVGIALIQYTYRCNLHLRSFSGPIVGTAIGICSSEEEKYKYRTAERTCPSCGAATIYRSKNPDKNTGKRGWYCWSKKGGCGAQYDEGDPAIENQEAGRALNPDLGGLQHTISAMAQKRAFVLAVRTTTGVSAYFSDDVADDEPTGRITINGTAAHKPAAPAMADDLIEFAQSLLPPTHQWSRDTISKACLKAMGIKHWGQPYGGTLDDAKADIRQAIEKSLSTSDHRTDPGQDSDSIPAAVESTEETSPAPERKTRRAPLKDTDEGTCEMCHERPATHDGPFPALCALCAKKAADAEAAQS